MTPIFVVVPLSLGAQYRPHRASPCSHPQPHYGLHSTVSTNRKKLRTAWRARQASRGLKARCLAPPCCPQPQGWLSSCLSTLEEVFATKESLKACSGRSKSTRRTLPKTTALNVQREMESGRETLPFTPSYVKPCLSETLSINSLARACSFRAFHGRAFHSFFRSPLSLTCGSEPWGKLATFLSAPENALALSQLVQMLYQTLKYLSHLYFQRQHEQHEKYAAISGVGVKAAAIQRVKLSITPRRSLLASLPCCHIKSVHPHTAIGRCQLSFQRVLLLVRSPDDTLLSQSNSH